MLVAPPGAFLRDRAPDVVVSQAERSAEVTHPHVEGLAGSVAVALAAWLAARSRGQGAPSRDELFEGVAQRLSTGLQVAKGVAAARAWPGDAAPGEVVTRLGNGARVSCQ